jgi:hypothetical protein
VDAADEAPRPDEPDRHVAGRVAAPRRDAHDLAFAGLRALGVVGEHRGQGRRVAVDALVGLGRAVGGQLELDQRLDPDGAGREQPQELLHVAVLGPAHVGDGVVEAALLVGRVVAPGPVGGRDEEVGLALVDRPPLEAQPDVADHDQAPLAPQHADGVVDDRVARARGGDEHRVGADAARPLLGRRPGAVGGDDALGAQLDAQRAPLGRRLDAQHATARRAQQLGGDEPDEAQADDDHPLAQRGVGAADALKRDRAHGGEGRVAQRHALGHRRDEVAGHRHDLGVVGAPGAGAGDVLADAEVGDPAGVQHNASARVAQDGVVGDRVTHRLDGVAHAVLAGVLEREQDEVGVADRAHGQRAAAARRAHGGALGPARDERGGVGDEHLPVHGRRRGNVGDGGCPTAEDDLLHGPRG